MTTAVLLGMTLSFEPVERNVMHRPPRLPGSPVLDARRVWRIALVSAFMLAGAFGLFLLHQSRGESLAEARTVAVNVFVMIEVLYLFNCRSLERSFVSVGLFSNAFRLDAPSAKRRWLNFFADPAWGCVCRSHTAPGFLSNGHAMC